MKLLNPVRNRDVSELSRNLQLNPSGHFPVGNNKFWHGGVHLHTKEPLQAIADGTVVAYRVNHQYPQEPDFGLQHTFQYSNGFVLIHHPFVTSDGQKAPFYSLYGNLKNRSSAPFSYSDPDNRVIVPKKPIPVQAGELVGHAGKYNGREYCHFEVFMEFVDFIYESETINWEERFHELSTIPGMKQGYCDLSKFIEQIAKRFKLHPPEKDPESIKELLNRDDYASLFPKLVCYYYSEWSAEALDNYYPWHALKGEKRDQLQALVKHVKKLCWYDQVPGLPDPNGLYFFHPIGFIEQMNRTDVSTIDFELQFVHDSTLHDAEDDRCTLHSCDDDGKTYTQTVALGKESSTVMKKENNVTVRFTDVKPGHHYTCTIDNGTVLFQQLKITNTMGTKEQVEP